MKCSSCDRQNRDGVNFCVYCGFALAAICSMCRAAVFEGDIYCGVCGHRLPSSSAPLRLKSSDKPQSPVFHSQAKEEELISERRTVTVLFADLSGFTAMSEKLDPEEVTTVMNNCLQLMGDTVTAYEGYIDKFIGDCIMALFGAPTTHENDPELALLAALQMSRKIDEYNKTLPLKLEKPLGLHIGINTGLVVAGKIGSDARMDYTVMGDTVNLASRLESNAAKGQIFVSAYTYNQTKNLFEFKEREPITVKGKKDPVAVYELIRVLEPSEVKSSYMSDMPLIGRAKEIEALSLSVERLQKGEGQAVFLISDPGFGKSRIQAELKNRFKQKSAQIIEGRCQSYGKNSSYHTFKEIFKRLIGVDADDMAKSLEEKLCAGIPLLIGEDIDFLSAEAKRAIVFVGKLFGLDLSQRYDISLKESSFEEIHAATIRSISWFFASLSRKAPTILSIEDLHNADAATAETIGSLVLTAKSAPIMLLLMLRPEKESSAAKLLPLARRVLGDRAIEMSFERLNRSECEAFVKHALKCESVPKELMDVIGLRSDGNPLFLQEILRVLSEQGAIAKEGGVLVVKKELSDVSIPNSITGLIIARFDKLDLFEKEVMSKAAVLGASFSRKLLAAMFKEEELDKALSDLVDAEMFFESQSFPEVEYSFHTTFIQEAVYDTLLLKRRQALHLEAADTISEIFADKLYEYSESLAMHYFESGVLQKAYEYFILSATKAKAAYANESAAKFFEKALHIAKKLEISKEGLIMLYTPYSEVLELLGDMQKAIEAWEAIKEASDEPLKKANALRNIGRIEEKRGSKDRALAIYEEALGLIKGLEDSLEYAQILTNMSWALNRFRRSDEAIQKALSALALFEKLDSKENIALCCNNLAVFYEGIEDFDAALSYNLRSLSIFEAMQNKRQIANVELSLGYLNTKTSDSESALKRFSRSSEIMSLIGNRVGAATALLAKGRVYADMGRHDEAGRTLELAITDFKEIGAYRKAAAALISLIQVLLDKKDTLKAKEFSKEALALAKEGGFLSEEAKIERLYAKALKAEGAMQEAKGRYETSMAIFKKLGRDKEASSVKAELDGV